MFGQSFTMMAFGVAMPRATSQRRLDRVRYGDAQATVRKDRDMHAHHLSRTGAKFALAALVVPVALSLASCGGSDAPVASVASLNSDIVEGYRIGSGDRLKVVVFDEASLSGEFEIGESGELALPLIGSVPASGKSTGQLAGLITQELSAGGYVLDPRVSIEVMEYRPFYILGEVSQPGEYPYNGDLTLQQAVAKAGGYTARANKNTVELQRHDWAGAKKVKVSESTLKIAPGDTVTILESFF